MLENALCLSTSLWTACNLKESSCNHSQHDHQTLVRGKKNIIQMLKHLICEYGQHDIISFPLKTNLGHCVLYILQSLTPLWYGFGIRGERCSVCLRWCRNCDDWWMVILSVPSWQQCSKTVATGDGSKNTLWPAACFPDGTTSSFTVCLFCYLFVLHHIASYTSVYGILTMHRDYFKALHSFSYLCLLMHKRCHKLMKACYFSAKMKHFF